MDKPTRVLQIGLGYIGLALTQILTEQEGYEIVGAVDINPALAGNDLGEPGNCSGQKGAKSEERGARSEKRRAKSEA